jgi:hypothetical protein
MLWYLMRMWTIFGWQRYTPYWFICILVFVEIKLFVMQFYLLKSLSFLKMKISIIQNLLYTDMTIKLQSVAIQIPDWVIFQSLALVRTAICWQEDPVYWNTNMNDQVNNIPSVWERRPSQPIMFWIKNWRLHGH